MYSSKNKQTVITLLRLLLCLGMLLLQVPLVVHAAPANRSLDASNNASNQAANALMACPAAPADLPDTIERTHFCVYYNDSDTSDTQATFIADQT